MPSNEDLKDTAALLEKNWEIVQDIIARLGDRSWKIKAWGLTVWWGVLGYSTTAGNPNLALYLLGYLAVVMVMDASVRVTQERFFNRSSAIEKGLRAYAVGDTEGVLKCRISTNVDTPEPAQMLQLLTLRRFSFWTPYLAVAVLTIVAHFVIP